MSRHWRRRSVDDLVEYLDVSLDEAETILSSAKAIVEARNQEIEPSVEGVRKRIR